MDGGLPWINPPYSSAPTSFNLALPTGTSPNATLDTSPSPTPSNYSSWWSGAGGPALIIVFTALGLLTLCVMLLVLLRGLRHRPYEDEEEDDYGSVVVSRLRKRRPVERPKIYELPIAYYKGGEGKENVADWESIMVSPGRAASVPTNLMSCAAYLRHFHERKTRSANMQRSRANVGSIQCL